MVDDAELLRRYAREGSEAAFTEVVHRHLGFVYHSALRQLGGDTHCAEDVTQAVFTDLARKAAALSRHPALASWLCTGTRFAALHALRTKRRWKTREQEAYLMNEIQSECTSACDWERLRPVIDDALCALNERDRQAVLLRFFAGLSLSAVGARLSLSEDAARMRVDRALDKLHSILGQRGISSTAAALGVILAGQPAMAEPASLAATVMGSALAGATTASSGAQIASAILMTKKIILTAAILAAIAAAFLETGQVRRANESARALALERDALKIRLRQAEQTTAQTRQQLQDAERSSPVPQTTAAEADANSAAIARKAPSSGAVPATFDDAELRKQLRAMNAEKITTTYLPLFDQLGFTPEQRRQFAELEAGALDDYEILVGRAVAQIPDADAATKKDAADVARQNVITGLQQAIAAKFGESVVQSVASFQNALPAAQGKGLPLGQ